MGPYVAGLRWVREWVDRVAKRVWGGGFEGLRSNRGWGGGLEGWVANWVGGDTGSLAY